MYLLLIEWCLAHSKPSTNVNYCCFYFVYSLSRNSIKIYLRFHFFSTKNIVSLRALALISLLHSPPQCSCGQRTPARNISRLHTSISGSAGWTFYLDVQLQSLWLKINTLEKVIFPGGARNLTYTKLNPTSCLSNIPSVFISANHLQIQS